MPVAVSLGCNITPKEHVKDESILHGRAPDLETQEATESSSVMWEFNAECERTKTLDNDEDSNNCELHINSRLPYVLECDDDHKSDSSLEF